jgi:hypothetical protein
LKYLVVLAIALHAFNVHAQSSVGAASGSQSAATVGVNAAPQQTLTVQSAPYPTDTTSTVRTAPQVFAPSMQPTTPCTSIISGGASVVGFGLSIGGSYEDKECTRREFARVLAQMGYPDAGVAVLCRNDEVAAAAPQLCKRSEYVATRPETYVGSEPPVMPPARIRPDAGQNPQQAMIPAKGSIGYGVNGQQMRYNGSGWISEVEFAQQEAVRSGAAAAINAATAPNLIQKSEALK